ncbi:hypothetical protein RJZ56_005840 [Blastomyces dermatitidis]
MTSNITNFKSLSLTGRLSTEYHLCSLQDVDNSPNCPQLVADRFQRIRSPDAGDTKAGTLIAMDRYGNKYYENMDELPLRTRWVDYKEKEFDASQIDVGWHAWLAYMVDKPPTQDAILQAGVRSWELPEHQPTMTLSRGAYKPYSTVRPKFSAWKPVAARR